MGWQDAPIVSGNKPRWADAPVVGQSQGESKPSYSENVSKTGEAFNKAAGSGLAAVGRTGVAALEDVAAMGSGVAGDIAGAVTSVATQDPKRGEAVRNAMTYEPRTEAGKAGAQYLGALVQPVSDIAVLVTNRGHLTWRDVAFWDHCYDAANVPDEGGEG